MVYQIRNNLNGKVYIGKTTRSLHARWLQHLSASRAAEPPTLIARTIAAYGESSFSIEEIYRAETVPEMDEAEKSYIQAKNSTDQRFGYNVSMEPPSPGVQRNLQVFRPKVIRKFRDPNKCRSLSDLLSP